MSEEWMTRAACKEYDPDLWFPLQGDRAAFARRICSICPVRIECLDFAIRMEGRSNVDNRLGIWGGMTPRERMIMTSRDSDPVCDWCGMRFNKNRSTNRFCSVFCRSSSLNDKRRVERATPGQVMDFQITGG